MSSRLLWVSLHSFIFKSLPSLTCDSQVMVEAASGAAVAAALSDSVKKMKNIKKIGVILCGGNVDTNKLPWIDPRVVKKLWQNMNHIISIYIVRINLKNMIVLLLLCLWKCWWYSCQDLRHHYDKHEFITASSDSLLSLRITSDIWSLTEAETMFRRNSRRRKSKSKSRSRSSSLTTGDITTQDLNHVLDVWRLIIIELFCHYFFVL